MALRKSKAAGFTLIETVIALAIATIVIGATYEVISGSLRLERRLADRRGGLPVLEAAAHAILTRPDLLRSSQLVLEELPGSPAVTLHVMERLDERGRPLGNDQIRLAQALLEYQGSWLEIAVLVPGAQ